MRTPPYPFIDADGHITETLSRTNTWAERMPRQYADVAPRHRSDETGTYWLVEGKRYPPRQDWDRGQGKPRKDPRFWVGREGMEDPVKRLPDLDEMGIETVVLFNSNTGIPMVIDDPGLALACSRAYNDWLHEYCAADPRRLRGVAILPVQDPDLAAGELRRAVAELGMAGALFTPLYGDKLLGQKFFYPIYQAAQDLDVPICVHNSSAISPTRHLFDNFVLKHAYSTMPLQMTLGSIVVGGVLDAFPRLRFAFLEAGAGWVPYVLERMQARYELLPHWVEHLKASPEAYMTGGQLFYSMDPDERTAPMVAQIVGEDRLVVGSDYAHWDGSAPESMWMVLDRPDLSASVKRKALLDNPKRLYRL